MRAGTYFEELGSRRRHVNTSMFLIKKGAWRDSGEEFWIAYNDPMRKGEGKDRALEIEERIISVQNEMFKLDNLHPKGDNPGRIEKMIVSFPYPFVRKMDHNLFIQRSVSTWKTVFGKKVSVTACDSSSPGIAKRTKGIGDYTPILFDGRERSIKDKIFVECDPSRCAFATEGIRNEAGKVVGKCHLSLHSRLNLVGLEDLGVFSFFRKSGFSVSSFSDTAKYLIDTFGIVHAIPLLLEIEFIPGKEGGSVTAASLKPFLTHSEMKAIAIKEIDDMAHLREQANKIGIKDLSSTDEFLLLDDEDYEGGDDESSSGLSDQERDEILNEQPTVNKSRRRGGGASIKPNFSGR